jgi:hypothetical protein
MVDNQIEEAFIFEDDAVLIKDWESKYYMEHKKGVLPRCGLYQDGLFA